MGKIGTTLIITVLIALAGCTSEENPPDSPTDTPPSQPEPQPYNPPLESPQPPPSTPGQPYQPEPTPQPYAFQSFNASQHTIFPGAAHTGCTTNFLFHENYRHYYIGTAAHCVDNLGHEDQRLEGSCADENWSTTPPGAPDNMTTGEPLYLIYNSWYTMLIKEENDPDTCKGNDFALFWIPPDYWAQMHPTNPVIPGPECLTETNPAAGDKVWGFGNSALWQDLDLVKPKEGQYEQATNAEWVHQVRFPNPAIPGDSGSALWDKDYCALGVAATIIISPAPAANQYTNLAKALQYAFENTGRTFELVEWGTPEADPMNPNEDPTLPPLPPI